MLAYRKTFKGAPSVTAGPKLPSSQNDALILTPLSLPDMNGGSYDPFHFQFKLGTMAESFKESQGCRSEGMSGFEIEKAKQLV